jgi:Domain of unknown function (DUF4917)
LALSNHPIDGSLCTWQEVVAGHEDWSALLLGNGLSRHVWGDFGYASLFDEAQQGDSPGSLTAEDLRLFSALSTKNFERVLADLATTIRVAEALGVDSRLFVERYQSIQRALGMAVRSVHVNRAGIRDETLEGIGHVLQAQEYVFTTSYDLIVYWAMGAVDYRGLCDCFWGSDRSFDPSDADVNSDSTPVYFLHGALHLVVMGSGVTRKLVQTGLQRLLDQFGSPLDGDKQARPLLITEGSSQHKLQAIEGNDYLAHARDQLGDCDLPLVVFGSDLGEQDQHLVEAVNRNPDRPVAVSIRVTGKGQREIRVKKAELRATLDANPLVFFDASTHPLGLATSTGG